MTQTFRYAGGAALVTGAAKRMGRAVALALAERGTNVVVHYHTSEEDALALVDDIRKWGRKAWAVCADLGDPDQANAVFAQACEAAGPVDILINNASIFPESRLADFSPDDLVSNVNVNALAPALIARQFAKQGREGAIINFLDCRIADYDEKHVAYHLSKRMLFSLTRMMALDFAPKVQVNALAPGLILPPEGKDEAYLQELASTNPLNRYGSLNEITGAVLFLLQSRFITGQVIYIDGGRHMKGAMYA